MMYTELPIKVLIQNKCVGAAQVWDSVEGKSVLVNVKVDPQNTHPVSNSVDQRQLK